MLKLLEFLFIFLIGDKITDKKSLTLKYCLSLLSKRDYAEAEIAKKLRLRGTDNQETVDAISYLKQKNFINDQRYAVNYCKNHFSRGEIRLKYELKMRGIKEEDIKSTLGSFSFDHFNLRAEELAQKWLAKNHLKFQNTNDLKNKLMAKLARQGFSYDIISNTITKLLK